MPPLRPLPESITSLSDQDLADKLKEYGVKLGPILASTRRVYERKLAELETGQSPPPTSGYTPVDDDDEDDDEEGEEDMYADDSPDEEVQMKQKQPRQRTTRTTRTETQSTRIETHTPPRVGGPLPRKPLHSGMSETPIRGSYSSSSSSSKSSQSSDSLKSTGGLPLWVKLVAIIAVAFLVFLVFKNMESEPESNIPEGKIELEV